MEYSHIVIGGGAIGLSIGARLARAGIRVAVLEKNPSVGQETSSRNSEVIHAGIYHPPDSLRTQLCIAGKRSIYELHNKYGVQAAQCGKWIVAQSGSQLEYLENMQARARVTGVELNWITLEKAKELEPAIKAREAILESPTTGIVSAHSLMDFYEFEIQKYEGEVITYTEVTGLAKTSSGFKVECRSGGETVELDANVVVNSAGLYAPGISNMLLPQDRHFKAFYAKGTYYSYAAGQPKVDRLVYPCPTSVASLGTHLTIDLAGRLRFGPDLEWVDSPSDYEPSAKNLEAAKSAVAEYIDLDQSLLVPDYCGIRPKITDSGFQDFYIKHEDGFPGFINLQNIESPGLTSSRAIGEYVHDLLR